MLTQALVRERLDYNLETGVFTWKVRPCNSRTTNSWNTRYAGTEAGYIYLHDKDGDLYYRKVSINDHPYRLHRIAWLYVHGILPERIDHIDGDGLNNKISNLRVISHGDNIRKARIAKNNTSGYKGVFWRKDTNRWAARSKVDGKYKSLGSFDSKEDAFDAYCKSVEFQTGEIHRDLITNPS